MTRSADERAGPCLARRALALLDQGETDAARALLAARFGEAGPPVGSASASELLGYRLHLALTTRTPAQDPGPPAPAAANREGAALQQSGRD